MNKLLKLPFLLLIIAGNTAVFPQTPKHISLDDYHLEHLNEFSQAIEYANTIKKLSASSPDPKLLASIVFPELMRYSQNRDFLESSINQIMQTVNASIIGFSIGPMQMKPAFAVDVERFVASSPELRQKYPEIDFAGNISSRNQRMERIKRLRKLETQLVYLKAFTELCEKKYSLQDKSQLYKIRIMATAYNAGLSHTESELIFLSVINSFPSGSNNKNSRWSYATLCMEYYQEY